MRLANHRVLTAARDVVAIARDKRETWAGKRFEQIAIAETVTKSPARARIQKVIDTHVEVIVAVLLDRRRYEVREGIGPIWQRIKSRDTATDGIDGRVG